MVGKVSGFTCFVTIHERERQTDGHRTMAGHAIHSAAQQQKNGRRTTLNYLMVTQCIEHTVRCY